MEGPSPLRIGKWEPEGYGASNEFVCVTSGVLLKQLEGLKKEAIQKADSAEV